MSDPGNVSERLGLDYLFKGRSEPRGKEERAAETYPGPTDQYVTALEAFAGERLLRALHEAASGLPEGSGVKLSSVAEQTQLDAQVLVPLCRNLIQHGLLSRVKRDSFGDDEVIPTDKASSLMKSANPVGELIQRLEMSH